MQKAGMALGPGSELYKERRGDGRGMNAANAEGSSDESDDDNDDNDDEVSRSFLDRFCLRPE